jgi:hypothetical protein
VWGDVRNLGNEVAYAWCNPLVIGDPLGLQGGLEYHHDLPKEFEAQFKAMGINVHDAEYGRLLDSGAHHDIHDVSYGGKRYNEHWKAWIEDPTADHTPAGAKKKLQSLFAEHPGLALAHSKGFCVTKGYEEFQRIRDSLMKKYGKRLSSAAVRGKVAKKLVSRIAAKQVPGAGQVVSVMCFGDDWREHGFLGASVRAVPWVGGAVDAKDLIDALAQESEEDVRAEMFKEMLGEMSK